MHKHTILSYLHAIVLLALASCGGAAAHSEGDGTERPMRHARNLRITDHPGGVTAVEMRNPWDTTAVLQRYVLVPKDSTLPGQLPPGTVLRTPLAKTIVYSSVHADLVHELGADSAVAGVCDVEYIYNPVYTRRLADGSLADCGSNFSPNLERIMLTDPEAVLLSPYENSNEHEKLTTMGIVPVLCADYMEPTPLGRVEWLKFYGLLYGCEERADSIFLATEAAYNLLKEKAAAVENRPTVLTDMPYGGVWSVPAANSTMGVLLEDAGARGAFASRGGNGSLQLAPEDVLLGASDVDFWLIRYNSADTMTMEKLGRENSLYTRFTPFSTGNVYVCNTRVVDLFGDFPFHPQLLLADFISIFHPELGVEPSCNYYTKCASR